MICKMLVETERVSLNIHRSRQLVYDYTVMYKRTTTDTIDISKEN